MMPSFSNLAVQNLKDTALASLISLGDLTFRAEQLRNYYQDSTTIYTIILFMYFGMALVLSLIMRLWSGRSAAGAGRGDEPVLFGYTWDTDHGELAFAISILPMLLHGLVVTIEASIVGFFVAMVIGLVLAVLKGARARVDRLARDRCDRIHPRHAAAGAALLSVLRAAELRHCAAGLPDRRARARHPVQRLYV